MEAIKSVKSWKEIKYLLWLKLCNANIHIYTLWLMDIQQQEKESLTAYVLRFKTEARRCNFTNDAATIRIFIKGLKNAHSLAMHIYKKGPQMLTYTISEEEKLNAAQQLTAMIIPPSTVTVMSNEEDCCFKCLEPGHISQISLILDAMSVMNMVTLSWTVHTEYLLQELQQLTTNLTEVTMPDQVWDTTIKIKTV